MTDPSNPPRLKQSAEFGELLGAAEPVITPERMAANGAAYKAAIASGASTMAAWKLLAVLGLGLAIAIPVAVIATRDDAPPPRPAPVIATAPLPIDEPPPIELIRDELPRELPPPVRTAPPPRRAVAPAPVASAAEIAPPDVPAPPAASELPEQIRRYEDARAIGQRGEFARAAGLIDDLLRRYPATPLRAEAELTRAELLARGDRYDDAVPALEALIANPNHRGRRGELLRTLGDLHRRRGDCAAAIAAYDRALAERVRDRSDVERSRALCAAK